MITWVVLAVVLLTDKPHTIEHFDAVQQERVLNIAILEAAQDRLKWRLEVMMKHPKMRIDYKTLAILYKELHTIHLQLEKLKREHNQQIGYLM